MSACGVTLFLWEDIVVNKEKNKHFDDLADTEMKFLPQSKHDFHEIS